MKIDIMIYEVDNITDVRTIVYVGDRIYSDGTGITSTTVKGKGLELEILESIKRHIITIQENILKE